MLRLLLWMLAKRIRFLGRRAVFRKHYHDQNITLVFSIGKLVRTFRFEDGDFEFMPQSLNDFDSIDDRAKRGQRLLLLRFQTPLTAFYCLTLGGLKQEVWLRAIQRKLLRLEGDFTVFLWFGRLPLF